MSPREGVSGVWVVYMGSSTRGRDRAGPGRESPGSLSQGGLVWGSRSGEDSPGRGWSGRVCPGAGTGTRGVCPESSSRAPLPVQYIVSAVGVPGLLAHGTGRVGCIYLPGDTHLDLPTHPGTPTPTLPSPLPGPGWPGLDQGALCSGVTGRTVQYVYTTWSDQTWTGLAPGERASPGYRVG
jgi:hypothetical protein